eukprot:TRINITY_DN211_c0_g1_i1.p1 TRINITY_DN211_c0_g1~~TRINITY_DN211_c0_g1_i1.p1  ORF type:complete len:357 (-),score=46.37 TRINITY_DN211_c0_g1_i1:62-1099(-)
MKRPREQIFSPSFVPSRMNYMSKTKSQSCSNLTDSFDMSSLFMVESLSETEKSELLHLLYNNSSQNQKIINSFFQKYQEDSRSPEYGDFDGSQVYKNKESGRKQKKRKVYKCGKCGQPKKGHTCEVTMDESDNISGRSLDDRTELNPETIPVSHDELKPNPMLRAQSDSSLNISRNYSYMSFDDSVSKPVSHRKSIGSFRRGYIPEAHPIHHHDVVPQYGQFGYKYCLTCEDLLSRIEETKCTPCDLICDPCLQNRSKMGFKTADLCSIRNCVNKICEKCVVVCSGCNQNQCSHCISVRCERCGFIACDTCRLSNQCWCNNRNMANYPTAVGTDPNMNESLFYLY